MVDQMIPEIALISWQIRPAAAVGAAGIEEALVPLGQMALSLFQEIGADDVVEADRAGAEIEVSEQREVEEPRGEFLDIERIELPELLQDGEGYVRILRKDRQLGESLLLFWR